MKFQKTLTNYLILINGVIFVLMFLFGGFNAFNNARILVSFGAQWGPLINNGQWFRLITSMFVHGGIMHIFFNMYVLYIFGNLVERVYGPYKFFSIYIITGFVASLATYVFSPMSISVGASGAIFGMVGLLFGAGFREDTPNMLRSMTGKALLPMILINVFLGFTVPQINNIAHIGGLAAGFTFGWLTPVIMTKKAWDIWKVIYYVCLAVSAISFVLLLIFFFL